jgi:hypothetical protein
MYPHAEITPLGHAPGTPARRERIEVSNHRFVLRRRIGASALARALQQIGEQLAVPCEFFSAITEAATEAPNTGRGKP